MPNRVEKCGLIHLTYSDIAEEVALYELWITTTVFWEILLHDFATFVYPSLETGLAFQAWTNYHFSEGGVQYVLN